MKFHKVMFSGVVACSLALPFAQYARAQKKAAPSGEFDQIAKRAAQASEENRLDEAARLYAKALTMRPKWAEGWWSLGTLEYDQDHYANAAADFQKLITLQPENGTAHAMLGLCEFELGKDDTALKNLLAAKQLGILNNAQLRRVTLYHIAVLEMRARRFGNAHEDLKLLLQAGADNEEVTLLFGESALKMRPAEAPKEATLGREVVLRVGKAEILKAQKQFVAAKQEYLSLVAEYPDYGNLRFAFGRFLLDAGEPDGAIRQFQDELQVNPRNVNALLQIAAVRYRVDSADGVKYAEEAVRLAPQFPFAHYLLGLLYLDTSRAEEAIPHLERARRTFVNEPSVYFALGTAYAKAGRKEEAAKARATFLRLNKEANKQKGPMVYGEQGSRPAPEELQENGPPAGPN